MSLGVGVGVSVYHLDSTGMFDFEKLDVYQKVRSTNVLVLKYLDQRSVQDAYLEDQLNRAALSILLNLAEGVGRRTKPDKRRFINVARSSLFETVSILQILLDMNRIQQDLYDTLYSEYTSISKMLLALYRSYG